MCTNDADIKTTLNPNPNSNLKNKTLTLTLNSGVSAHLNKNTDINSNGLWRTAIFLGHFNVREKCHS